MNDLHEPVVPMAELAIWSENLRQRAREPLEFCPHLPEIGRRAEAWWQRDLVDRPLFLASANTRPDRPITRRLELLDDPDAWYEAKFRDMCQLHRVGDTLPILRIEVPILSGMMQSHVEYSTEADTTWTHPSIGDDWSDVPAWRVDESDRWFVLGTTLARRVAQDARGRYVLMTGGVGMGGDALMSMRGSEGLCTDCIDRPEVLRAKIAEYDPLWQRGLRAFYDIVTEERVAIVQNVAIWSNRPYITPQCDFSYMIGTHHFNLIFRPEIARQTATIGRAIFHLDGPGVARHLDAILEIPDIQAIQWVPGAGLESTLAYVPMLREIQRRGRALQVACRAGDVLPLCEALRPEGLCFSTGERTPEALDALYATFCRHYGVRS